MKRTNLSNKRLWQVVFGLAAVWTAIGAILGILDTARTFARFYGFIPDSALLLDVYRGAWGQSLLFAIGYGFAAYNPRRYSVIVALGLIGKVSYAIGLYGYIGAGTVGPAAVPALVGDLVFAAFFTAFLISIVSSSVSQARKAESQTT